MCTDEELELLNKFPRQNLKLETYVSYIHSGCLLGVNFAYQTPLYALPTYAFFFLIPQFCHIMLSTSTYYAQIMPPYAQIMTVKVTKFCSKITISGCTVT